ncbi:MAG TPA: ABC transporter permease [Steroidobacteraceae bacterium]|nr:ABC transporter permease [Steroidobacteraceae bacterium]
MITAHHEQSRQTLRRLRRDWAFTAAFVVTLALAIAANVAVFSALDAYFLRPLPYPGGQNLVNIYFDAAKYPLPPGTAMSAAGYQELRSINALAASGLESDDGDMMVAPPGELPQYFPVCTVTASTLQTLGVQPLLGRWINPAADRDGGPAEVDVGYRLWQSVLYGDPHVLGRALRIAGKPYTVVGVMPRGFAFPARRNQLWISAALTPSQLSLQELTTFNFAMIGRLRAGISRAQLGTELAGVTARLEQAMAPEELQIEKQVGAYTAYMPLREFLGGTARGRLLMMQLGAGILLLLAVASLANLALARALRRRDEVALRVVLGAGRRALLGQASIESVPLAAAATLIAWPLTELGMRALTRYGIASANTFFDLRGSAPIWVLAFAVALVLAVAALALPQVFVDVHRPSELLYGAGRGGGSGRRVRPLRLALSVGQIGLAIALLTGALFIGRSLRNMLDTNPGFDTHNLYVAMLLLQGPKYGEWGAWLDAHQRLAAAVAALPGVRESGIGEAVPFAGDGSFSSFRPAQTESGDAQPRRGGITQAGSGFLRTLGVHLLAGRLLDPNDAATGAANVVIDERFADALFGSPNVVGKTLKCSSGDGTCRIVGVVSTIRDGFASHYARFNGTVFVPEDPDSFHDWGGATTILIRSTEPPALMGREMREIVHRTLPDQALFRFLSMQELISDSAQSATALATLLIAFGLLAFTLAIIGTYGVVAYVTRVRRREFAVRQAVGAQPVQIESLVLGQGLTLWALGTVMGVGCALMFARILAAQLYRVSLFSPATYALPVIIVGAAVMLASWIPARGARRLDLTAQVRLE